MATRFTANQSVEIIVPDEPISIQHYLRQPHRLISALADMSRIQQLSADVFRYHMRALTFMSLKIQPIVDLRVWTEANGMLRIESAGCEILGIEAFKHMFSLNMQGYLAPDESIPQTCLRGIANLEVTLELPPPFCFTPRPILETTGNGLLKSVLLTIHQRLRHQLLADYRQWVHGQMQLTPDLAIYNNTIPSGDIQVIEN